jgi:hypothetical protein
MPMDFLLIAKRGQRIARDGSPSYVRLYRFEIFTSKVKGGMEHERLMKLLRLLVVMF